MFDVQTILRRKTIVNVQKTDNIYCLSRCILAHLHRLDSHREQVSHWKQQFTDLFTGNIQFSMKVEDIPKTELLKKLKKCFSFITI